MERKSFDIGLSGDSSRLYGKIERVIVAYSKALLDISEAEKNGRLSSLAETVGEDYDRFCFLRDQVEDDFNFKRKRILDYMNDANRMIKNHLVLYKIQKKDIFIATGEESDNGK